MTFSLNKIKITFDYLSAAAVCMMIILSRDSRLAAAIICTVIHECGHLLVMMRCGCKKAEIKVNLFNAAIIDKERNTRSYKQDAAIICAGPAANLITALIALPVYVLCGIGFAYNILIMSIMLAAFNLLPMESTDGGQLLLLLLKQKLPQDTSQRIMTVISLIVLLPVATVGFLVLLHSKYNYTLLFAALYLVVILLTKGNV